MTGGINDATAGIHRRADECGSVAGGGTGQRPAVPVVRFFDFGSTPIDDQGLATFRQGLAVEGFIDNRNVVIEFYHANGELAGVDLAPQFVRGRASVIVVVNSRNAVFDAKSATETIPIVFMYGGDPVRDGIVASPNRPGSNLTGVMRYNSLLGSKRLIPAP
jgi:putative tryptophan/tyrosine transport system substrate-binding protein